MVQQSSWDAAPSIHMPIYPSVPPRATCLSIHPLTCPLTHLSTHSAHLSICLSLHPFIHLPIHPFRRLSTHPHTIHPSFLPPSILPPTHSAIHHPCRPPASRTAPVCWPLCTAHSGSCRGGEGLAPVLSRHSQSRGTCLCLSLPCLPAWPLSRTFSASPKGELGTF